MTKQKSTKRALLMSALALLMCVSMLIGSTFAWFTDSVTSAGNKIKAGKLDIQLLMDGDVNGAYDDISDSTSPIFGSSSLIAQNNNADTLWEPGKTQVAYLAIKNNGNLDLKYTVGLNVQNVSKDLYKVMEYAIVPDADANNKVTAWNGGNSVVEGTQSVSGDVELKVGETHYFALAIHMDEEAGNEYQEGEVDFDLTVLATQLASESDSFNNQYDKDATYPVTTAEELTSALAAGGNVVLANDIDLATNTTITLGNGVESTLDLNGHTLAGENTRTATHIFMIDVKGGTLNVSNGTIAMKHTGTNMGWNGATTVIDVTAGGVLNLDGVTVKNEGGTDMNFAVHLNNWGEVTLNADNCVFSATYCGVRVNNSGPDMNNVKITNSTLTGATRAFWVHNYVSSDMGGKVYSGANAAYDKAVVDARLDLDIYNNNNTFEITGTATSPIRYGFNESVYYDASGNIVE